MTPHVVMRDETPGDAVAISAVSAAAFATLPVSNHTEGHREYCPNFGLTNPAGLGLEGVPPDAFFSLPFDGRVPQGVVTFHNPPMADSPH